MTLIMTVGLPRSGKSTWAKAQGLPVVNPDSIRLVLHGTPFLASAEPMVWSIAETMVHALFLAGHEKVILDATNLNLSLRNRWQGKPWTIALQIFDATKEQCIARAKESHTEYLIPIIERMARYQAIA